jgi:hypothetical protein
VLIISTEGIGDTKTPGSLRRAAVNYIKIKSSEACLIATPARKILTQMYG